MATPVEASEVIYEPGAWMNMALTESRNGNTFKLSDYSGKAVILETMDPGCPVCSVQVKERVATLEGVSDNVAVVSVYDAIRCSGG